MWSLRALAGNCFCCWMELSCEQPEANDVKETGTATQIPAKQTQHLLIAFDLVEPPKKGPGRTWFSHACLP